MTTLTVEAPKKITLSQCEICGEILEKKPGPGRKPRFCPDTCAVVYKRVYMNTAQRRYRGKQD